MLGADYRRWIICLNCGRRICTFDLQVMGLTSYLTATIPPYRRSKPDFSFGIWFTQSPTCLHTGITHSTNLPLLLMTPTGFEPDVTTVKGWCPRPLDHGAV